MRLPDSASLAAMFAAGRKVLYPFLQLICYGFLGLAAFAVLFIFTVGHSLNQPVGLSLWVYTWLRNAWSGGLLSVAVVFGFVGLLFLRFWEKLVVLGLMLAIAWLAR